MILPQTFGAALFVLILGLLCLGSWPSAYKWAKLRWELSYFDFAAGVLAAAVIWGLTVGNLGFDGFSLMDDLIHAGKRQWFFAIVAGILFNFGNMLLMASVSVSGLSTAFPVAFAAAMILSTAIRMIGGPAGSSTLNLGGCLLLLLAIVLGAAAANIVVVMRHEANAKTGKTRSTRRPTAAKPVILAVAAGILLGLHLPLVDRATVPDIGLGPYTLALLFSAGLALSTAVLSIFFINLPAEGEPAELSEYLKAGIGTHLRGLLSGGIWCTGALALFISANTADLLKEIPTIFHYLKNAAPLIVALWGWIAWKEFRETDIRAKSLAILMLVFFACGLLMLVLAPLHPVMPT